MSRPALIRTVTVVGLAAVCVLGPAAAASAAPRAADWPTSAAVENAYGIDFGANLLYVAQRDLGISSVDSSGVVTRLVTSADSFMSIAVEASGDLLVTVDSDPNIYRIDIADLSARPEVYLTPGGWRAESTVVLTSPNNYLYALDVAADGTIYYTDYTSKQVIRVVDGVETPLLAVPNSTYYTDFDLSDSGDLTTVDDAGRMTRISAAAMQDGSVAPTEIASLRTGLDTYGIAFFSNGVSYLRSTFSSVVQDATGPVPAEPEEVEETEEPPVVAPAPSTESSVAPAAVTPTAVAELRAPELAATGPGTTPLAGVAGAAALLLGAIGISIGRRRARSTAG
jgi:hypothetical protein